MSHSGGREEPSHDQRDKIRQVCRRLGALTRLTDLVLGCNVPGDSLEIELEFTFDTRVEAMAFVCAAWYGRTCVVRVAVGSCAVLATA